IEERHSMNDMLPAFLASQAFRLPFLIALIVAVVLACARYRAQGKSAAFAGWGFGLLMLAWFIRAAQTYFQLSVVKSSTAALKIASLSLIGGSAAALAELAGVIPVMVAVFAARNEPAAR